jgi:hypothetical protein
LISILITLKSHVHSNLLGKQESESALPFLATGAYAARIFLKIMRMALHKEWAVRKFLMSSADF